MAYCAKCRSTIPDDAEFCPECGSKLSVDKKAPKGRSPDITITPDDARRASARVGKGRVAGPSDTDYLERAKDSRDVGMRAGKKFVPPGVASWSWGALAFGLIWGLVNQVWISLMLLIPIGNIIMPFVLAAKGKEWAWEAGTWRNVQHFRRVQRRWDLAGIIALIAFFLLALLALIISLSIILTW